MTSALPSPQQQSAFAPALAAILVPERGTHIPALYVRNPHPEPDKTVVTQNGVALLDASEEKRSFMVSQVAPERRWAILEDGELMSQQQFDVLKKQGVHDYYDILRANGHPEAKYVGNVDREPIPDVAYFVRWCIDPMNEENLLEIGFDAHETDGAVPEHFHDNKGDQIMASRMEVLTQAFATKAGREQMSKSERREVELYLGVEASAGTDGISAKLEMLTALHKDGDLSDAAYLKRVSALTGVEPADEDDSTPLKPEKVKVEVAPVSDAKQPTTALCGKADCKGEVGKKAHERKCVKCKEIATEG